MRAMPMTLTQMDPVPSYTLHTVFDDSLDAHWSLSRGSIAADDDTPTGSSSAYCARHLHLPLDDHRTDAGRSPKLLLALRARSPMYGMDEQGIELYMTFLASARKHLAMQDALSSVPPCSGNESRTPTLHALPHCALRPNPI